MITETLAELPYDLIQINGTRARGEEEKATTLTRTVKEYREKNCLPWDLAIAYSVLQYDW